jgi:hypothetical protein
MSYNIFLLGEKVRPAVTSLLSLSHRLVSVRSGKPPDLADGSRVAHAIQYPPQVCVRCIGWAGAVADGIPWAVRTTSYFSHLITPLMSLLAFIKSPHACKSFRRYWPHSAVLISRLKNNVGWFVVREKYCSGWKNKLKKTDYKPDEHGHYFLNHITIFHFVCIILFVLILSTK